MLVTFSYFFRSRSFTRFYLHFNSFLFHLLLSNVLRDQITFFSLSPSLTPRCSLFLLCIASLHKIYCAITMSISRLRRCFYFTNAHTHTHFLSITLYIKIFIVSLPCFGSLVSSILFIDFPSVHFFFLRCVYVRRICCSFVLMHSPNIK